MQDTPTRPIKTVTAKTQPYKAVVIPKHHSLEPHQERYRPAVLEMYLGTMYFRMVVPTQMVHYYGLEPFERREINGVSFAASLGANLAAWTEFIGVYKTGFVQSEMERAKAFYGVDFAKNCKMVLTAEYYARKQVT